MDKNKRATIWAGVALAMVIVMVIIWPHKRSKNNQPASFKSSVAKASAPSPTLAPSPLNIPAPVSTSTPTSTPPSATSTFISKPGSTYGYKPKKAVPKSTVPSYGEVVSSFDGTGHRIQFNPSCQAVPNQIATANGSIFMLDNRSDMAQTITIGGQAYVVAAYNYVLVTLSQKTLPSHLFVTCNTQINTAEIFLE